MLIMIICDHANIKGPLVLEMYKTEISAVKVIWLILAERDIYLQSLCSF